MSLRGAIEAIPLEAVLQLLADTGKSGRLLVRGDERAGALALSEGKLVSARSQEETGPGALGEIFTIDRGEFGFAPGRVDENDLSGDLDELLDRAVAERDRIASVRQLIPDERMRFSLSPRAAERAEIRLSADQWRALLAVDGQRDVIAVAGQLGIRRLAALELLAGLVRAGMVDTQPPAEGSEGASLPPREPLERSASGEPIVLSGETADFPLETIVQLLAHTGQTGRLEIRSGFGTSTLGMAGGRLVSARAEEESGDLALGATFAIERADFQFVPMTEVPATDLTGELDELLDRAAEMRVRIAAIRALVPNERGRFVLSDRATQHPEIRLKPDEWRALLAVNGERDLGAMTAHLGMRRLPTMVLLADLIEGGLVDVVAAPPEPDPAPRYEPPPAIAVAEPESPPTEAPAAEALAAEVPLAETPLDVPPWGAEDRLSAITGVAGSAVTVPPSEAWPAAEPITEVPPPPENWWETPGATGPPAEQPADAAPSWERPAEAAPAWEQPAETPAEPETYIDPRLAAFGAPAAEPVADEPTWAAPATEAVAETPPAAETTPAWPPAEERPASELVIDLEAEPPVGAPPTEPPAADVGSASAPVIQGPAKVPGAQEAPSRKGLSKALFGGMFGGAKQQPVAAPPPAAAQASTRAGQLALFVNELLASYNSGQYGKGRVDDRMVSLLMRVDEQADPVDRPIPVKHDRLDVVSIDGAAVPEGQSLPYLAMLARQVYDDAERALGKDKAKRGFRDTRERLFGKDLSLFQMPEIAPRVPKV